MIGKKTSAAMGFLIPFASGEEMVSPGLGIVISGQSSWREFPRNLSNASLMTKDYSRPSRAHLTVSTVRVSFQTSEVAVVEIS